LQALEHKDIGSLQRLCGHDHLLVRLAQAAGPAPAAFAALAALDLPAAFAGWVQRLERITACLQGMLPEISITVDPIEQRGFEYHEGVGFSIFAPGAQIELGRGGRYITAGDPTEVATGATLFMDVWRTLVPVPAAPKTIMVPHQTSAPALDALHQAGYVTIAALADTAPLRQQAAACGCVAVYENGQAKTL
jgi:ATP phosphoribosyltransferase regulatory subunit